MMNSREQLENKLRKLKPFLSEKYFVDKLGYFGSFVIGNFREDSDIDILITLRKPIGWEFFDIEMFLEKELGRKIDLVTENALKSQLKNIILNQVIYV